METRKRSRTLVDTRNDKQTKEWISWKEACTYEDEDILLQRVKTKKICSRVHEDATPKP